MHKDHKYIEAIKNNDSLLIAEVYKTCFAKIERMVLQNNGTEADAADIFQDALVDIYHKAFNGFTLTCPLDAFLYLICKNRWLSRLKKIKHERVTFIDSDGYDCLGEDVFEANEILQQHDIKQKLLDNKFKELGDSCKELLTYCISGKALEEIAKLMNTSYGYIRRKKSDCMGKLIALIKTSPEYILLLN